MKEVKINPLILTLLIVLAILGIISFIILLSNPTLITVIFGNNSIFNFNNTIKPPIIIGECNVDSDCPQTACVRSLNCPAIVCENRKCVAKNPIPSNALSCNSNDDCILYNADLGFDNCCGDYIINNSESKWQPINRVYYTNKVNEVCANDMRGYGCSAMPIRIIDNSYMARCINNKCAKISIQQTGSQCTKDSDCPNACTANKASTGCDTCVNGRCTPIGDYIQTP